MRVVFFGSSEFSVPTLQAFASCPRHEVVGVAAQPDRPSGRNRQIQRGVVHAWAADAGLPVILPERIGSPEALAQLGAWRPELIVVASFGQFIPAAVRQLPSRGIVNVHPSLLPKYRGAAPLQWSIACGETVSGVTIFHVVREMDAGDIILQERHPILPDETAVALSDRFARIGADLAVRAADLLETGNAPAIPQDTNEATYAPKISKDDGRVDWAMSAAELHNRVRGFQPWPGVYFDAGKGLVKVWRSRVEEGRGRPGEVINISREGPLVMTGNGALRLLEVQPEGKKIMSADAFLCGQKWSVGIILPAINT